MNNHLFLRVTFFFSLLLIFLFATFYFENSVNEKELVKCKDLDFDSVAFISPKKFKKGMQTGRALGRG